MTESANKVRLAGEMLSAAVLMMEEAMVAGDLDALTLGRVDAAINQVRDAKLDLLVARNRGLSLAV